VLLIKRLLYDEGFTIAGARRHLRDANEGPAELASGTAEPKRNPAGEGEPPANISRKVLLDLRDSLRALLTLLETE